MSSIVLSLSQKANAPRVRGESYQREGLLRLLELPVPNHNKQRACDEDRRVRTGNLTNKEREHEAVDCWAAEEEENEQDENDSE